MPAFSFLLTHRLSEGFAVRILNLVNPTYNYFGVGFVVSVTFPLTPRKSPLTGQLRWDLRLLYGSRLLVDELELAS
jgi:hypothetical protein